MPVLAGQTAAAKEIKIGSKIANLTFKDIRYLPRSLADFPNKKAFVLVFTNTTCPLVQRYIPTLKKLEKQYRGKEIQFLAVNVGADDSIMAMAAQAIRHEVDFPFVKDQGGRWVRALGVRRTPAVAVLDRDLCLRYRGRIDDQYRLGGTRPAPTRHDLRAALDELLAGRAVTVQETPVDGCLITFPKAARPAKPGTFAAHIAPLLHKHCQGCHNPNGSAPFALASYKQAAARADMIAEVVAEQRMPPWYASPEYGHFINRRGLTAAERDAIVNWARSGTPLGDEKKLVKPQPARATKWRIGKPDLVVRTPFDHNLPAEGDIPYKYAVLPHVFHADTWVQGVEIRPDNPRVLHHCNMAFGSLTEPLKEANFITGIVPGGEPMTLDHGVAFRIPKGSMLALQIHYVSTGKKEKCRISVGLKFARGVVQKRLRFMLLADRRFAIPPGASAHPVSAGKVLTHDAIGVGLFVHMHLRGKDMTFRARLPGGKTETLLLIPNYSFSWQIPYRWEPGKVRFPKGTRLECIAHYDNSAFNPYNPNPTATVRDGPQTYHEMMNGFIFFTDANEKLNLDIDPKSGRVRTKKAKGS
jgi:thiol-disulfide isomerase/thioredoxin